MNSDPIASAALMIVERRARAPSLGGCERASCGTWVVLDRDRDCVRASVARHGSRQARAATSDRKPWAIADALVSAADLSTAKTWIDAERPPAIERSGAAGDRDAAANDAQRIALSDRVLGATVRRGTLWSLAGYGGSQALRFAGNLVLTRML